MSDRVLVIGLDGATWSALDPLMAEGAMPALAGLVERGFVAPLESTVPPVTAPAWSSFITGQNPGRHGIYQFYEIDPWSERALGRGEQTFLAEPGVIVNGKALGGPKLWEIASGAGKRCVSINLPMTYPPSPINGLMVTDMLTPPGSKNFTWPPELAEDLADYEIDLTPREKDFSSTDDAFLVRAESVLDKRGRAMVELYGRDRWDLFIAIITETDRLQHRYWHLLAPDAPASALRERVVSLYRRVDAIIGTLLTMAGDDVRVMIVSDHGFGHAANRRVSMEAVAVALGLGKGPSASGRLARFGITKRRVYKYLGFLVPDGRLRNAERMARDRALSNVKGKLVKLHDYIGGVWIHREGRGGPVSDVDYTAYRADLTERLRGLRDPKTRDALVERVAPREDIYAGSRIDGAPDLVFWLRDVYGLDPQPRDKGLVYDWNPPNSGTHRSDGIALLAGPGIVKATPVQQLHIEDAAPTILQLLNLPIPEVMDGRVLAEAFDGELAARPVRRSGETFAVGSSGGDWESDDEQEEIMERLRGIGYVE